MYDVDLHDDSSIDYGHLYMDGLSHWKCSDKHDQIYMVSFDWSNEIFCATLVPPNMNSYGYESYDCLWVSSDLVLLNGSIALILTYKDTATLHISILGELGVKESWTKIFIVGPLTCLVYPIGAGNKGDILFRKKKDGELAWLDLNTQKIKDLGVKTAEFRCKIIVHKENLLPFEGESI
ncbi:hypothetical protein QL285_078608 [Trifolium repens]|jgi:molecular chaperone HtpG|nr:hypothetical protein QL285_078608 [Trifolium repens]